MKNLSYKISFLGLLVLFSFSAFGQSIVSKTIEKSHYLSNEGALYLDNKYGDVLIYGWDKNTIKITVNIEAKRKTDEDAKALLKRIKSNITATKTQVIIESEILEKETSFFNKYIGIIDPFKNEGASTTIDYVIYLPKLADIEVNNKYGNIIVSDWGGQLKAKVEHGDLRITDSIANSKLRISYGKLRAYTLYKTNIQSKGASLHIRNSNRLKLVSEGSEISINNVESLELYSNNDNIEIEALGAVFGTVKYSKLEIEKLKNKINLELNLAELRVLEIQSQTPKINVEQKASEVYLNISDTNFDFSAQLEQGVLRVPKTMNNVNSELLDKKKKRRSVIANYGSGDKGIITITGLKGVVILKEL